MHIGIYLYIDMHITNKRRERPTCLRQVWGGYGQ